MHHKLDVKPIPENVLYINELDMAAPTHCWGQTPLKKYKIFQIVSEATMASETLDIN